MRKGNFYPKGVKAVDGAIQFVFRMERAAKDVAIAFFAGTKELLRIPIPDDCRHGLLYSVVIDDLPKEADSYCYYAGESWAADCYAGGVIGMKPYGREKGPLRYALPGKPYDWEEDGRPEHPYGRCVIYGIHVRGFTRHTSSGVRRKGTFAGVVEKLPYLKELGVTTLELMPAYEFDEYEKPQAQYLQEEQAKINYWGFKAGYYYAPKSAYAHGKDARTEMKDMVRILHKSGIEVLMQFYFPESCAVGEIMDILRFWAEEYHIDGFHLIGRRIDSSVPAADPFLKDTKIILEQCAADEIPAETGGAGCRNLAVWQESFTKDMRRALKGDEGCLKPLLFHLGHNHKNAAIVNAIAGYNGFTLYDMVSYDRKHNEANGEDNRDGTDCNDSWNCGAEGKTRKRTVQMLRCRQMYNAMTLVLLSQGTPYIQSGSEFGQTQEGNNNPYCQDNRLTWLNWKLLHTNRLLFDHVRWLIRLRRAHKIFHREEPLQGLDYLGSGCPDISFHGKEAWKPETDYYNRHAAVMYCGKYAKDREGNADADFYLACNMHWEPHRFALPKLPRGMVWKLVLDTADMQEYSGTQCRPKAIAAGSLIDTEERSIQLYESGKKEE